MDILFSQLRRKYPEGGHEAKEGSSPIIDQKTPPLRTQPFKGEKPRNQSWIRRQFSRQISRDYDATIERNFPAAVAAAAFAIKSLEQAEVKDDRKGRHSRDTSLTKIKDNADDTPRVTEPRTRAIKFSDEIVKPTEQMPEKATGVALPVKKKLSFAETTGIGIPRPQIAWPVERAARPARSNKNQPTFGDKRSEIIPSRKPEIEEPKPDVPPLKQPPSQPDDTRRPSPGKLAAEDTQADAWEKAELTKIRQKYEKLNLTILEWENKNKRKAKRKLEKTEAELDKRRAKAMHHYRSELSRIDAIAGGAQSQAIKNRRNEEIKVKDRANKIRLTAKVPATCLCC